VKEVKEREEERKQGTYSGAMCSIAGRLFSVNANCFVKCMYRQRIIYTRNRNYTVCDN
jgi:hypothetical protein